MSEKDFRQGVEAGATAIEDFMLRQASATEAVGRRIIKKFDEQGQIIDVILDELNDQEKKRLYNIRSGFNIAKLGQNEKEALVSCLLTLRSKNGQGGEQQITYYRNVKKYLSVVEATDDFDYSCIQNVDSRSAAKAMYRVVCEFLFLKRGNTEFLHEFETLLGYFGQSQQNVKDVISEIEYVYDHFGIEEIENHFETLVPERSEPKEKPPVVIPFFQIPVTIVYDEKEKGSETWAELLSACIYSRLDALNVKCKVSTIISEEYEKDARGSIEKSEQIIFLGTIKAANAVSKIINWEYDEYGMKYGTNGHKSIICVSDLKRKQISGFIALAKKEQEKLLGRDIPQNVASPKMNPITDVLKGLFDEGVLVGILTTIVASPYLLKNRAENALSYGKQCIDNRKATEQLTYLQYLIAIESFLDSKIDPYVAEA